MIIVYLYIENMNLFGESESIHDSKSAVVAGILGERNPWIQKWAPKTRSEMILPPSIHELFDYQMSTSGLKNCTFFGGPGIGKTTLARLLAKEMNSPVKFFNASQMKIDSLRDEILSCGRQYVFGSPTVVILDECDKSGSEPFWNALRNAIDETLDSLRFILTANYVYNIPEPILSRCPAISFEHTDQKIRKPIFNRLIQIAETETTASGGSYDKETLAAIARKCYPDLRMMISTMSNVFDQNKGSITGSPIIGNGLHMRELYSYLAEGKDIEARAFFNDHFSDYGTFFIEFCDFIQMTMCIDKPQIRLRVGELFAEYNYRSTQGVNQELNVTRGLFAGLIGALRSNG